MESNRTALASLIAVVFMGTTALFAWQYVRARNDAASFRQEASELNESYKQIQQRLEDQETANFQLMQDISKMHVELERAMSQIKSLTSDIESLMLESLEREQQTIPD